MRFICLLTIVASIAFVGSGCGKRRAKRERPEVKEGVTVKPEDVLFINFNENWRRLVNTSPQIVLPVVRTTRQETQWQPVVTPDCVFSPDAGRMMPQITLTWNEIAAGPPVNVAALGQAEQEGAGIRFDLGLHHDPFTRNYFSSALATDKLKRFTVPSNSPLANDAQAVMLTGPGLFPKLVDYRAVALQERGTNRPFTQHTLVMRDLSQGLTYTIRMSRLATGQWNEEKQFAFLAPVCPNSF
jgi:hypothetical protein